MNIAEAKLQIKDAVEAYLQKDDAGMYLIAPRHQRPVFLIGAPGIGKTAIMEQVAAELGIGIVSYSMTHHTRQSALGLPVIQHREFEGYEYESSEYTMSEIVAAIYDYIDRTGLRQGILFLDEINCVSETLYPSMLQFLQFKTFGRHRIPEDWVVVCAGNPPEYNKSVHEFDIVTLDRLRTIEVEPDYGAWKRYANSVGIHPAITTFLEAKQNCFYKVESRPGGGKAFVTARGWEDLAEVVGQYERMDKKVNRELIVQFLCDEDVADRFSVYYALFDKYRSDYQVGRILAGDAGFEILNRAKKADFDERVALLSLLLDALATSCQEAMDQEAIVLALRDELRAAKPKLMAGESAEDTVLAQATERERKLSRKIDSGTAMPAYIRHERIVCRLLKDFVAKCDLERTPAGDQAFTTISRAYKEEVDKITALVDVAGGQMDNAFGFVERAFGNGREMIVFVAELTTRQSTTQYVAHYGNDSYYAHNSDLQVDSAQKDLARRIQELQDVDEAGGATYGLEGPGVVGLRGGTGGIANASEANKAADTAGVVAAQAAEPQTMQQYYNGREFEYGFASMSRMTLDAHQLAGKRVLDVCCRRGKGVYKLSAKVGETGTAIGADPSPTYIEDAKAGMQRAWQDNHLKKNNMEFMVAYPEDLSVAGVGDASVDVVYINNVTTLLWDQGKAFAEFARVLKPGGLLICETVVSDVKRDEAVVAQAKEMGNSVQAARTEEELFALLAAAGFGTPEVVDRLDVRANQGYASGVTVPVVETDEQVTFQAIAVNVLKG
ncbi:MAG: methyltransferase domain-containing protein [Coriobacteriia bacterium]|nr:methyltransferase domain-containing protein [Coriobacteriia bacterium]